MRFFSKDSLEILKDLHSSLEKDVKFLKSIESLENAKVISGDSETVSVDDLYTSLPKNNKDMESLLRRIKSEKSFNNFYYSKDHKFLTLLLQSDFTEKTKSSSDDMFDAFDSMDETNSTAKDEAVIKNIEKKIQSIFIL